MSRRRALRHEDAIFVLVVLAIAIPAAIALPLVWFGELDLKSRLTLTLAVVVGSGGLALAVRARVMRPLQTLANLTASLRERDYAVRGRHARRDDSLGLAMAELGELAEQLRAERWRDEEASAGLARVVEGLDAAVIAVDGGRGPARQSHRRAAGWPVARGPKRRRDWARGAGGDRRAAHDRSRAGRGARDVGDAPERSAAVRHAAPADRDDRRATRAARRGAPGLAARRWSSPGIPTSSVSS